MRRTLFVVSALALLCAAGCAGAGRGAQSQEGEAARKSVEVKAPDLAPYFKGRPGTFVLYDLKNDRYLRHDPKRAAERFPPFSTFKIPNSIIGLETGVIKDAEFEMKWDSEKYPPSGDTAPFNTWWQDQTLRTAFKRSAVWYYRELALMVGEKRMKEMVSKLGYGNEDISGGLDRFWLGSTLKISADEQVEFLKAFHQGRLPVSERSVGIVKEIMVIEETPEYKLSGKTGGGPLGERRFLGWLVGFLETKDNTHFFAIQIEGPTYVSIRDERLRLTKQILTDLGLMKKAGAGQ
ncbi:MAG TPA: penicillin-binding transpeptidase domain-containing protein [Pyrinomonadaceae bacterium]|nr:penicillin-binding transpeptidase domain-containing protein [Pyrinomonadaceae bacterium]